MWLKESKYFIGLKMTCLGVLDWEKRDKTTETGLKERGVIEMSTTVLPLRDARSLSLCIYLPSSSYLFNKVQGKFNKIFSNNATILGRVWTCLICSSMQVIFFSDNQVEPRMATLAAAKSPNSNGFVGSFSSVQKSK